MKHPVSYTQNKSLVNVDLIDSPAAKRIAQQPQLLSYAREILQGQTLTSDTIMLEYDMGRQIGFSSVIPTSDSDTVFYARTLKDKLYTRFVKVNKPLPTQHITVCLKRSADGTYELYDLWFGHFYPPQPGSNDETNESRKYWLKNAFMFDNQPLQASTITKVCPY